MDCEYCKKHFSSINPSSKKYSLLFENSRGKHGGIAYMQIM